MSSRILILAALCGWLAGTALAAEGDVPLEIKNVKVTAADWVVGNSTDLADSNAARFESVDGMVHVVVELALQLAWRADDNAFRMPSDTITLSDGRATYPMVGRVVSGVYSSGSYEFSVYRDGDRGPATEVYFFSPVFRVPARTPKASLNLGGRLIVDFDLPAPTTLVPDAHRNLRVEILSAQLLDAATGRRNYNNYKLNVNYTNPYGKILEVNLRATPIQGNLGSSQFQFLSSYFSLLLPSQTMVSPIGERLGNDYISTNHSTTVRSGPDGTFRPRDMTLYFGVPANLSDYTILVTGHPVATGRIGQ